MKQQINLQDQRHLGNAYTLGNDLFNSSHSSSSTTSAPRTRHFAWKISLNAATDMKLIDKTMLLKGGLV